MTIDLLIGNEVRAAAAGRTFEHKGPRPGDEARHVAAATKEDAMSAADAAAKAFPAWSRTGPDERRRILLKAAELVEAKAATFIETMGRETGASEGWAKFNVALGAGILREAASLTTQVGGEVIPSGVPGSMSLAIRVPAGVVVGIAPWNAPVILGLRAVAMALACGNCCILKASEVSPATHLLIGQVLLEAGLPPGAINVVTHAPADASEIVETLIAHPSVRRINFTGSTRVGRLIAQTAARHLKPVLLELGGKAPIIVLDDADIDAAVDAAAFGAFLNNGQICMSTERAIVDEAVADEFAAKLAAKARALAGVRDADGVGMFGAMIGPDAAARAQDLVADAVAKGAQRLTGDSDISVIDGVRREMRIYSDESFGPVIGIIRVSGADEAVRVANDSEYGLSAAVFGRDVSRALSVAQQIESGICHINGPTVHDEPQMPFGGVKSSGYGRFGGRASIDAFTELRWITIQTEPRHYPF